jgi:hypothetical protein
MSAGAQREPAAPEDVFATGVCEMLAPLVAGDGVGCALLTAADGDAPRVGVAPGHALPYAADGSVSPARSAVVGELAGVPWPFPDNSHAIPTRTTRPATRMKNRRRQYASGSADRLESWSEFKRIRKSM